MKIIKTIVNFKTKMKHIIQSHQKHNQIQKQHKYMNHLFFNSNSNYNNSNNSNNKYKIYQIYKWHKQRNTSQCNFIIRID